MEVVPVEFIHLAATTALSALVGAIVAGMIGRMKQGYAVNRAEDAAMREGMLALLRSQLTEAHDLHVVRGAPMTLYARENLIRIHKAYEDLGGNDIGDAQFDALMKVPLDE